MFLRQSAKGDASPAQQTSKVFRIQVDGLSLAFIGNVPAGKCAGAPYGRCGDIYALVGKLWVSGHVKLPKSGVSGNDGLRLVGSQPRLVAKILCLVMSGAAHL